MDDKQKIALLIIGVTLLSLAVVYRVQTLSEHKTLTDELQTSRKAAAGLVERARQDRVTLDDLWGRDDADEEFEFYESAPEEKTGAEQFGTSHPVAAENPQARTFPSRTAASMHANRPAKTTPSYETRESEKFSSGAVVPQETHAYPSANVSPLSPDRRVNTAAGGQPVRKTVQDKKMAELPFAPYLTSLTKEQEASLNKQLTGLSDRVEEALLRAMLPKSKKDMNIEKYLSRNKEGAGTQASGPYAAVARQIGSQKASIMASMKQAFGDKAANDAGQIMDAYQQEMMNTLNQPNQTQQQLQQKARQVSQKYNDKLQKLSEKNAQERFKADLEKRDSDLMAQYKKAYDSKTCAGLGKIMDKYRAEELALAQQGLGQEEYLEKYLALQRARDEEMRKYLTANGKSADAYLKAQGQEPKENPDELPVAYKASKAEQNVHQKDAAARTQKVLDGATQIYGKEAATQFEGPIREYNDTVKQIWANPETSAKEKKELEDKAVEKFNRQVQEIQRKPEMQDRLATKQAESHLQELKKENPAFFKDATPEQVAAFEEYARPILKDMYTQLNDVEMNDKLSTQQKEQEKQKIRQAATRKLSGQE